MNRLFGLQHRGVGDGDYNMWSISDLKCSTYMIEIRPVWNVFLGSMKR